MSMFCYQCQETAKNTGCTVRGVCGKSEEVAKLQDLVIYTIQGIADIIVKGRLESEKLTTVNEKILNGLFMTITNANFDDKALEAKVFELIALRDSLIKEVKFTNFHDASAYKVKNGEEMLEKA